MPRHPDRRGRLRPLPERHEGRARRGVEDPHRSQGEVRRRQEGLRRGHPAGAARLQDRLLRPGLHADARGGQGIQVEPELRRHRHDVARAAASSAAPSWARSRRPSTATSRTSPTCCWTSISRRIIDRCQASWRKCRGARGRHAGIPVPAFTTALAFYDGYRSERLPANLLQAQRDYFGAHTYERVDQPRGKFFHTNWTGKGGNVSAGTYTV